MIFLKLLAIGALGMGVTSIIILASTLLDGKKDHDGQA